MIYIRNDMIYLEAFYCIKDPCASQQFSLNNYVYYTFIAKYRHSLIFRLESCTKPYPIIVSPYPRVLSFP